VCGRAAQLCEMGIMPRRRRAAGKHPTSQHIVAASHRLLPTPQVLASQKQMEAKFKQAQVTAVRGQAGGRGPGRRWARMHACMHAQLHAHMSQHTLQAYQCLLDTPRQLTLHICTPDDGRRMTGSSARSWR
jgi:hypothetical protein